MVLAGAVQLLSRTPPGGGGQAAGPLRYYLSATTSGMQVRKTATGAVTASIPTPFFIRRTQGLTGVGAATGDGGREFVVAYTAAPRRGVSIQTRLYSFHLTGAGRAAGLSLAHGGLLDGVEAGSAWAVSPDGSKIALAVYRPVRPGRRDRGDHPQDRSTRVLGRRPAPPGPQSRHPEHLLGPGRSIAA